MRPKVLLIQGLVVASRPVLLDRRRSSLLSMEVRPVVRIAVGDSVTKPVVRFRVPTSLQELADPLFGCVSLVGSGDGWRGSEFKVELGGRLESDG